MLKVRENAPRPTKCLTLLKAERPVRPGMKTMRRGRWNKPSLTSDQLSPINRGPPGAGAQSEDMEVKVVPLNEV